MDSDDLDKPIEELVHELLQDQDRQVAREIRDKLQVLNGLLATARERGLRIESETGADGDLRIRVFKEI